jgi:hypothetical protein
MRFDSAPDATESILNVVEGSAQTDRSLNGAQQIAARDRHAVGAHAVLCAQAHCGPYQSPKS